MLFKKESNLTKNYSVEIFEIKQSYLELYFLDFFQTRYVWKFQ